MMTSPYSLKDRIVGWSLFLLQVASVTLSVLVYRLFNSDQELIEKHTDIFRDLVNQLLEESQQGSGWFLEQDEDTIRTWVAINSTGYVLFPQLHSDVTERWTEVALRKWRFAQALHGAD